MEQRITNIAKQIRERKLSLKKINYIMKKILIITIMLLAFATGKAQSSNLIFFTQQGERFSVILNGIRQNPSPETNIKVTDLPAPSYKLKIIFEDRKLGELDKTIFLNQNIEATYAVRKNNKKVYVVRYMNEVPLAQAPINIPSQSVIVYHSEPIPTITTTTTTATPNVGVGISINDPYLDGNAGINMNVGGVGVQTTTTTTTTSSGTTAGISQYEENVANNQNEHQGRNGRNDHNRSDNHHDRYVLKGYNGAYGCAWPMAQSDFEQAKSSINSKTFEDSKLTIAKQIVQSNCLLSSQVREIMLLFTFEDTRLEFAKFAYAYTLDLGNYYKVNDAFTFESSIDELNRYVQNFRR